jgi:hypothetical protein
MAEVHLHVADVERAGLELGILDLGEGFVAVADFPAVLGVDEAAGLLGATSCL